MDNKEQGLEVKTLQTALRPPRVAIFFSTKYKSWENSFFHLIEVISSIWGGDSFIVIPTDGKTIDPVFQELLKFYDPDFLFKYQKTGYDVEASNPKYFNKVIDSQTNEFSKRNNIKNKKEIAENKKMIRDSFLKMNFDIDFELTGEALDFLKKELSVFHYKEDFDVHYLDYSGNIGHELPKLIDVLLAKNETDKYTRMSLNLKKQSRKIQLMGYANSGLPGVFTKAIDSTKKELQKEYERAWKYDLASCPEIERKIQLSEELLEVQEEKFARDETTEMVKSFWGRYVDVDSLSAHQSMRDSLSRSKKKQKPAVKINFFQRLPFFVANFGLAYFTKRTESGNSMYENPLIVVGDTIKDFCLYYSLIRMRNKVYWLPYSFLLSDSKKSFGYTSILINESRSKSADLGDKRLEWVSLSLGSERKKSFYTLIKKCDHFNDFKKINEEIVEIQNPKKLLTYVLRAYEKKNANNFSAYQFLGGKGVQFVDTPMPKSFKASDPLNHKWINEVNIDNYRYPKSDGLICAVLNTNNKNDRGIESLTARVSSMGIHYKCHGAVLIRPNDDISDYLLRPKLNIIDPLEIFQSVFGDAYHIKISDKGAYLLNTLKKVDGLENLFSLISNKQALDLFELFQKPLNQRGVHSEGVYVSSAEGAYIHHERKRFVDFSSVENLVGSKDQALELVENLLKLKLLKRGFILKCSHCKNASWYPLEKVGQAFECIRCSEINLITNEQIQLQPKDFRSEPVIYYKLDEIFHQFWRNNGYVTAATLYKLKSISQDSLIFIPEVEFRKDPKSEKPNFEIDIAAVMDGRIYLGEAKKDADASDLHSKLSIRHIDQFLKIGERVSISGLVFSSWSSKWPQGVKERLESLSAESNYEILLYGQNDLL